MRDAARRNSGFNPSDLANSQWHGWVSVTLPKQMAFGNFHSSWYCIGRGGIHSSTATAVWELAVYSCSTSPSYQILPTIIQNAMTWKSPIDSSHSYIHVQPLGLTLRWSGPLTVANGSSAAAAPKNRKARGMQESSTVDLDMGQVIGGSHSCNHQKRSLHVLKDLKPFLGVLILNHTHWKRFPVPHRLLTDAKALVARHLPPIVVGQSRKGGQQGQDLKKNIELLWPLKKRTRTPTPWSFLPKSGPKSVDHSRSSLFHKGMGQKPGT